MKLRCATAVPLILCMANLPAVLSEGESTDLAVIPSSSLSAFDLVGDASTLEIRPRFGWGDLNSLLDQGIQYFLKLFGDNPAVQYFASLKDKGFELVKSMVLRCGKSVAAGKLPALVAAAMEGLWEKPGPWDAVLCDTFLGALNKDPSQIQSFGLKECNEAVNEDPELSYQKCAKENMYAGDKFELAKALFTAATGQGEIEDSPTIKAMTDTFRECNASSGGNMQQCLTLAFVRGTCKGICSTSDCLINEYKSVENEKCQEALEVSCGAMYQASYQMCKQLANLLPEEQKEIALGYTECSPTCRAADRSVMGRLYTVFSIAAIGGVLLL